MSLKSNINLHYHIEVRIAIFYLRLKCIYDVVEIIENPRFIYIHYPKQSKREEQLLQTFNIAQALEDYSKSLVARNTQSLFTCLRGVKSSDYRRGFYNGKFYI